MSMHLASDLSARVEPTSMLLWEQVFSQQGQMEQRI